MTQNKETFFKNISVETCIILPVEKSSLTFAILRKRHIIAACVTVQAPESPPLATDTSCQTARARAGSTGGRGVGQGWGHSLWTDVHTSCPVCLHPTSHTRCTAVAGRGTNPDMLWVKAPYWLRDPPPQRAAEMEVRTTQGPCCPQETLAQGTPPKVRGPAQLQRRVLEMGRWAQGRITQMWLCSLQTD